MTLRVGPSRWRAAMAIGLAIGVGACVEPAPSTSGTASDSAGRSGVTPVIDRASALEAVVARAAQGGVPERFGYGVAVDSARLRSWDIDIMPDGRGLPAGSGTVAEGAQVYAARCAPCHGVQGEGGPNDRLVTQPAQPEARSIGTWWPYSTTLFDYVRRAMPWDRPGTLSDDEVYAVVAWLLNANGLAPEDAVMDATTLPAVEMPAQSRFVPDDRERYTTVH